MSRPFIPAVGRQSARRAAAQALQARPSTYQHEATCTCRAAHADTPAARGEQQGARDAQQAAYSRRSALALSAALVMGSTGGAAGSNLAGPPQPANIRPELAPDQASYDASDERLRDAAQMLQQSLNAESVQAGSCWGQALGWYLHRPSACRARMRLVQEEERLWGVLIDKYEGVSAPWAADILGRAYGNRGACVARARTARRRRCSQAATRALCAAGNARSRQGKWDAALADLTRAQEICPWSVDPVLNRRAPRALSVRAPPAGVCNPVLRHPHPIPGRHPWRGLWTAQGPQALPFVGHICKLKPVCKWVQGGGVREHGQVWAGGGRLQGGAGGRAERPLCMVGLWAPAQQRARDRKCLHGRPPTACRISMHRTCSPCSGPARAETGVLELPGALPAPTAAQACTPGPASLATRSPARSWSGPEVA